jgi:hypothetical protein
MSNHPRPSRVPARLQAVPRGLIAGTHPSVCREPTASFTHSHTTPLPHTCQACVARTVFSAALLSCLPPSLPTPALAPRAPTLSPPLRHDLRLLLPPNMTAGRFTYPGKPPESAGCFHVLDVEPGIQSVPQPAGVQALLRPGCPPVCVGAIFILTLSWRLWSVILRDSRLFWIK